MPAPTVTLAEKPELKFGVWNTRYKRLADTSDPDYHQNQVGWKAHPSYGLGNAGIFPSLEAATNSLTRCLERWEQENMSRRRTALDLKTALEGLDVLRVVGDDYYGNVSLHLAENDVLMLQRSRWSGFRGPAFEGPTGPFTIARVLATGRTLRLTNGEAIIFPRKMELVEHTISLALINRIYGL